MGLTLSEKRPTLVPQIKIVCLVQCTGFQGCLVACWHCMRKVLVQQV